MDSDGTAFLWTNRGLLKQEKSFTSKNKNKTKKDEYKMKYKQMTSSVQPN